MAPFSASTILFTLLVLSCLASQTINKGMFGKGYRLPSTPVTAGGHTAVSKTLDLYEQLTRIRTLTKTQAPSSTAGYTARCQRALIQGRRRPYHCSLEITAQAQLSSSQEFSATPEQSIDLLTTRLNHWKAICKQNALEKSSVVTSALTFTATGVRQQTSFSNVVSWPSLDPASCLLNSFGKSMLTFPDPHLPAKKALSPMSTSESSKSDSFSPSPNK